MLVLTTVLIVVCGAILNGWTLSILWSWFFVSVLGLPELTIAQAIGVSLTINFLTAKANDLHCDTKDALAHMFVQPLVALGIGLVVRSFM